MYIKLILSSISTVHVTLIEMLLVISFVLNGECCFVQADKFTELETQWN